MKKLLTLCAILLFSFEVFSQCTEIFFSEYVEGSHNNKSLELYNPTSDSINLDNYRVVRFSNGSIDQKAQETINLTNLKIGPNGTLVLTVDIREPGTGADTPVFPALQARTNAFLCPSCNPSTSPSRALCFNGDDAIGLQKNDGGTWKNIDIFGKIGERPTNSWTDQFPFNNNIGAYWTRDQTLIRKASVRKGVTTNPDFFNPTTEWDSLPRNTFDSLGGHRCDCSQFPASSEQIQTINLEVYPNPIGQKQELQVHSKSTIMSYSIVNVIGIQISQNYPNQKIFSIPTHQLVKGIYLISFTDVNNKTITKKVVIK